MPEIWFPYGPVEVAISLKVENLFEHIESKYSPMSEESIGQVIAGVDTNEKTCILLPNPSKVSIEIVRRLLHEFMSKNISLDTINLVSEKQYLSHIRKSLSEVPVKVSESESPTEVSGKIDNIDIKLPRLFNASDKRIIITDSGFDPLFGYAGGPSTLVRYLKGPLMAEAFKRRDSDIPQPGTETNPYRFAKEIAGSISNLLSIEVISDGNGISSLFSGNIIDAQTASSKTLRECSYVSGSDDLRAVIVSAGGLDFDLTLSRSLRALYNVMDGVKEKGYVGLVAECSGGLGSEALKMFVSGRLDMASIRKEDYVDGLEDLVYLKEAQKRYNLMLVSILPTYYVEMKLGLRQFKKAGDAFSHILSSSGAKTKVSIISNGSLTLLAKASSSQINV